MSADEYLRFAVEMIAGGGSESARPEERCAGALFYDNCSGPRLPRPATTLLALQLNTVAMAHNLTSPGIGLHSSIGRCDKDLFL